MKIEELADRSYDLLKNLLHHVNSPSTDGDVNADFRRAFALSHAQQIRTLAEDALDLEDRERTASSPLLIRGMLESLFILGSTANQISFAGEKVIYDMEQSAKFARNDAKKLSAPQKLKDYLADQASGHEELVRGLREDHQITGKLSWNPSACAEKAGLFRQYAIDYAIYSAPTHGELLSMIFAQGQRTSVHAFRTIAFICLEAVRFIQSVFESSIVFHLEEQRKALSDELRKAEAELRPLYLKELSGQPVIGRNRKSKGFQAN